MFNRINSANSTLLALNQNGKFLQESIDTMFNQLNPVVLKQDADITGPLKQLSEFGTYIKVKYAKGIKDRLSGVFSPDQEYHKNDINMLNKLIDSICDYRCPLKEIIREQSVNAISNNLLSFSDSDFIISDESSDRESVNFNRMLPTVGFASQSYGYLGRKIISEGVKGILEGSQKDVRYRKFEKVIFDQPPSNEAVRTQISDYFMVYLMTHGDELDELYDEGRLAIQNCP